MSIARAIVLVALTALVPACSRSRAAQVKRSPTAGPDLCAGLIQDKDTHAMTPVAKPAVGQTFVDPQFHTTIRRISDAGAAGVEIIKPMYSTIPAWNTDESYLLLYHSGGNGTGHHLYDGTTYKHIKQLDIAPADLEQVYWDTTNPKILYYVEKSSHKLHRFNVDTDTNEKSKILHDFSKPPTSCTDGISAGGDPMWTSWDSKQIAFLCGDKHFTYNIATDTVGKVVALDTGGNAAQAAPSGALFFLNVKDVSQVRDGSLNLLRTLRNIGGNAHASLGTSDGVDTFFSVQFEGPPVGSLIASNLVTGASRTIIGKETGYPYPPSGTHVSAVAYKRPGWVAVSGVGSRGGGRLAKLKKLIGGGEHDGQLGQGVLDGEVVLVDANSGGSICRVAHHHSCGRLDDCGKVGYFAEPHVVISPTATRILFGSDWGGEPKVDTYVVELPSYRAAPAPR